MTVNQLFTTVFNRLAVGWAEVNSFREVALAGIPKASTTIIASRKKMVEYLTSRRDWSKMIKDQKRFEESGGKSGMLRTLVRNAMASATASVDAASLVFSHSIVDAAASGFLRVTAAAAPKEWEKYLDKRKLTVAEVREKGYQHLFDELLEDELNAIERNTSLPKKCERLLQICRPEKDWIFPLKFDEKELERIDDLRHDVIHGDRLGQELPTIEADVNYLTNVGWYFMVVVQNRYNTKLEYDEHLEH